jgi:beta-galactosidase
VLCRNNGANAEKLNGEVLLSGKNGFKRTLPFAVDVEGGATKEVIVRTVMNAKEVHLWNCNDPFLYYSQVSLTSGGKVVHTISDRFGLRKIEIDNKNYLFKLNGESIRMMGFNLVPDDRTTGVHYLHGE